MKPLIKILLLFFASLLIVIAILGNTEPGLRFVFSVAQKIVPGELKADQIQGRLFKGVNIRHFYLENNKVRLNVQQISFNVDVKKLFLAKVAVNHLEANNIKIERLFGEKRKPFSTPIPIILNHATLSNIEVIIPNIESPIIIDQIQTQARIKYSQIEFSELTIQAKDIEVDVTGTGSWRLPRPIDIKSHVKYDFAPDVEIKSKLNINGDVDQYQVKAYITKPFALAIAGEFSPFDEDRQFDILGQWQDFIWPLVGDNVVQSPAGKFKISGSLDDYALALQADLQGKQIPNQTITLTGQGNTQEIALDRIEVNTLEGVINGKAELQWLPQIQWKLHLHANHLNLSEQWPDLASHIDFTLDSHGDYIKKHIHFQIAELDGHINQLPLSGEANFTLHERSFNISESLINIGNNHIAIDGGYDQLWSLNWELNIHELQQLLPQTQGKIKSQGRISGPTKQALIEGDITVDTLQWQAMNLAELNARVQLDLDPQAQSNININLSQLAYKDFLVEQAQIVGNGPLANHQINTQIQSQKNQLDFLVNGQYNNQIWQGILNTFTLNTLLDDQWILQKPANMTIEKNNIELTPLCLSAQTQKICFQAQWQPQSSRFNLQAKDFDTKFINTFLPNNAQIETQIDLNAKLSLDDQQQLSGALDLKIKPGHVSIESIKPPLQLSFQQGRLQAEIDQAGLQADMSLKIDDLNQLQATATMPNYNNLQKPLLEQTIKASTKIVLTDLSALSSFIPKVDEVAGQLNLNFDLSGKVNEPIISSDIKLQSASASIVNLGLELENINLHIFSTANNDFKAIGSVNSGEGQLSLKAVAQLDGTKFAAQTIVKGQNFTVIDNEEYQATVSPQLQIKILKNHIDISGKIIIPQAKIAPLDFSRAITLPDDVVFIEEHHQGQLPIQLATNIEVILGDSITLSFMGLTGEIKGQVNITETPGQPPTANGEINIVNGQYSFFGQTLDFSRGQLFYANSPLDNPGINIRATRTISGQGVFSPVTETFLPSAQMSTLPTGFSFETFIVGIDITGQAQNPKISLFSEPDTLPRGDILSYLALGQSLSQVSDDQAGLLIQAIGSLNLGGTEESQLLTQVQQAFGLEQISFETQQYYDPNLARVTSGTALVIGKALSPRIFISSSLRLREQRYIMRINYILAKNWIIQSTTDGQDTGIDLLYTFERK